MIERILVVGQGPNDIGFLQGLRDRLGCKADLIDYATQPLLRQRGRYTRRKDARYIWDHRGNVDLIIRLTDGDTDEPQYAIRKELERWPSGAKSLLVCGVCDRDVEHWMCLDPDYVAKELGFDKKRLPEGREQRSGFIKNRIGEQCGGQGYTAFVATFVTKAPSATVQRWLSNPAFSDFYDRCRDAAQQRDCPVENLRDAGEGGR